MIAEDSTTGDSPSPLPPTRAPGVPLTDAQWARIEPLLQDQTPKLGGRWRDHRQVIDAIACKFQTGKQWVHLPEKHGNWRGVYKGLRMWALDGT
ncbi:MULTISPECIES: transposase [unclassified Streptomyces]|uniref:transposase n=1 Tax=unclassified Streptomyces TaxID=2593676 RepID=UPI002E15716A|nr:MULTISPECIES: transposase [unclassified Streptomyces]WSQ88722.1 transposase [Streptomyces sp. NBC_01212]WSR52118.1 transposase [Streptomyces sp. NBC_01201]